MISLGLPPWMKKWFWLLILLCLLMWLRGDLKCGGKGTAGTEGEPNAVHGQFDNGEEGRP